MARVKANRPISWSLKLCRSVRLGKKSVWSRLTETGVCTFAALTLVAEPSKSVFSTRRPTSTLVAPMSIRAWP